MAMARGERTMDLVCELDIIDIARDPLLVLGADSNVTAANGCFCSRFSSTPERGTGRSRRRPLQCRS